MLGRRPTQVENRKGNKCPAGWSARGPGYDRQLSVSGKNWMTVIQGTWLDEWGGVVILANLEHNVVIRCKRCDLLENGEPLGSCSAHVVKKNGSQGVWCWSCNCMFWENHETARLVPSWPLVARNSPYHTTSENFLGGRVINAMKSEYEVDGKPRCTKMVPVDVLFECKVICLDAPTGYGKTFMLVEYAKIYRYRPVLVRVAWRSLCHYYKSLMEQHTGETWELYCSVPKSEVRSWMPSRNPRVILCYPSLCMLNEVLMKAIRPEEGWGLWLDECVALSHFTTQTAVMSHDIMRKCDKMLTSLVKAAPWRVMAQYNMRMDSPPWILDRLSLNVEGAVAEGKLRTIRVSEELLWKGKTFIYTHFESGFLAGLRVATLLGYGEVAGQPHRGPVYCIVNYASKAEMLACWLRDEAKEYLLDRGWGLDYVALVVGRIRVITADMKAVTHTSGSYDRRFFTDTEVYAKQADVLITTYVVEAGVSMPVHFRYVFAMLYKNIANWDSQFQSVCRIREENVSIVAYLQEGIRGVGLCVKSRRRLPKLLRTCKLDTSRGFVLLRWTTSCRKSISSREAVLCG